jgi:hypothetical protein
VKGNNTDYVVELDGGETRLHNFLWGRDSTYYGGIQILLVIYNNFYKLLNVLKLLGIGFAVTYLKFTNKSQNKSCCSVAVIMDPIDLANSESLTAFIEDYLPTRYVIDFLVTIPRATGDNEYLYYRVETEI